MPVIYTGTTVTVWENYEIENAPATLRVEYDSKSNELTVMLWQANSRDFDPLSGIRVTSVKPSEIRVLGIGGSFLLSVLGSAALQAYSSKSDYYDIIFTAFEKWLEKKTLGIKYNLALEPKKIYERYLKKDYEKYLKEKLSDKDKLFYDEKKLVFSHDLFDSLSLADKEFMLNNLLWTFLEVFGIFGLKYDLFPTGLNVKWEKNGFQSYPTVIAILSKDPSNGEFWAGKSIAAKIINDKFILDIVE